MSIEERTFKFDECPEEKFSLLLDGLHQWQKYGRNPLDAVGFTASVGHHIRIHEPEMEFSLGLVEAKENMYESGVYLPILEDEYSDFLHRVLRESERPSYVGYCSRSVMFLPEEGFVANTVCGKYQICLTNEAQVELRSDWVDR